MLLWNHNFTNFGSIIEPQYKNTHKRHLLYNFLLESYLLNNIQNQILDINLYVESNLKL